MDVSIIIVNYNTREYIDKCLKTIIKQTTKIKYEIIVIDNASSDNSVKYIKNKSIILLKIYVRLN